MPKRLIGEINNSISFNKSKNTAIITRENTITPKTNKVLKILSIFFNYNKFTAGMPIVVQRNYFYKIIALF